MAIPSAKTLLHQALQRSGSPEATAQNMPPPPPDYTYYPPIFQAPAQIGEDHPDSDMETTHSSITISISAPVTIIGHANLVAIDPVEMGINIAQSIFRSIKECSVSGAGMPMIDEEGRPRPIEVRMDSGIKVQGTKNIIGEKAVLFVLQTALNLKREREGREDNENELAGNSSELGETEVEIKRQRAA